MDLAVTIDADTPEAAIALVADGDGDEIEGAGEYSHTLDPDTWTVEADRS